MSDNLDGNATENGDGIKENGENGKEQTSGELQEGKTPRTVPYDRFKEVNAKRKSAEDALTGIAETISADLVPENYRALIPNLPAAEKIKWIFEARKQGLFNPINDRTSGPDAMRPVSKTSIKFQSNSPVATISQGFKGK